MANPTNSTDGLNDIEEVTDEISDVRWMDIPVLVIFLVLLVLVATQFFTRYVLNDSLSWTEEISRYFLIFLGFVGGITCIRKGSHIYLEFFYRYLSTPNIKRFAIIAECITASFFLYLGVLGIQLAERTKAQSMVSVQLPKSIIYYTVTASCFLMAFFAVYHIWRLVRSDSAKVADEKLDNLG